MKAKLVILLLVMVLAGGLFYYLTSSKTYHVVLPLTFDANNIPQVEVEIEGKFYLVEIDLNAPFPFALNPELFHNIAIKSGTSYIIPSLKLGSIILCDLPVTKLVNNDLILWRDKEEHFSPSSGYIGRFFLRKYAVIFDFPHKRMLISNDQKKLELEGFSLDKMVKIPLECGRKLTLTIDTDVGRQRVRLTTTSTVNILNRAFIKDSARYYLQNGQCIFASKKLDINGHDFGPEIFYVLPEETTDGALGMGFLEKQAIYIDCQNKVLYVKKS